MSGAASGDGRRGVVIDRDGTLIDFVRDVELGVVTPAFHPDHLRFLPGVLEALRALADAGFVLSIATNQPQAAKGQLPESAITRTNAALVARLAERGIPIARVETCLHHPDGGDGGDARLIGPCDCRKPAPGLLLTLARELGLDPARSWFVGDTPTDVRAARAAGMRSGFVTELGRCELCPGRDDSLMGAVPDVTGRSLDEVARRILERDGPDPP